MLARIHNCVDKLLKVSPLTGTSQTFNFFAEILGIKVLHLQIFHVKVGLKKKK